jgi:hypothetical protein
MIIRNVRSARSRRISVRYRVEDAEVSPLRSCPVTQITSPFACLEGIYRVTTHQQGWEGRALLRLQLRQVIHLCGGRML